jgi:hypothetical protein
MNKLNICRDKLSILGKLENYRWKNVVFIMIIS